jgi:hypothetical protein
LTNWTRNDSIRLGEIAYQVGLTPEDAEKALIQGAKFLAHGFSDHEINELIQTQYRIWAEEDEAMRSKTATISQARRWWEREKRSE